ncbi:MAG TPA: sulfite exporter TauE/SafE family protein [Fimbriimonadaceae bacterium]|nr:sulfite exporter TauE/SafE family protein [Fimbriimonadaceae bacterium]
MLPLLAVAALLAGGVASIAGFGIGSILTPAVASSHHASLAIAAVSIPHFLATAYRFWLIRGHLDKDLLRTFGIMSAVGGLAGAGVATVAPSRVLEIVLAVLLLFVGVGGLLGWTKRLRFTGFAGWMAGVVSGFLGGLVGNQGGLRAGAMVGLGVSRDAFVATATATGLIVDAARMPIYFAVHGADLLPVWPEIAVMSVGALMGTYAGMRLLRRIPEERFYTVVYLLLIALAIWLIVKG